MLTFLPLLFSAGLLLFPLLTGVLLLLLPEICCCGLLLTVRVPFLLCFAPTPGLLSAFLGLMLVVLLGVLLGLKLRLRDLLGRLSTTSGPPLALLSDSILIPTPLLW